jgi:DNA polymerase/3'-5' exonuclease PolX
MKRDQGMTLAYARDLAEALVELLRPACQRIEIAGSVRRGKARPNDIEIVAVPRWRGQATLMWGVEPTENMLDLRCLELLATGQLEKRLDNQGRYCWGTGIKRAIFYQGKDYAPLDLFQVVGSAQWGVIYAIRTGPGDFNHRLVTSRALGGACPLDRKVAGGRVWDLTAYTTIGRHNISRMPATKFLRLVGRSIPGAPVIPTPEEEDFFAALGVPCWPPEQRTDHRLVQFIRQDK